MFQPPKPDALAGYAVEVPLGDRWCIYHRLQELMIPCACSKDGSLRVEVNHGIAAILLRSTVQQFTASRQELVDWLERCWYTEVTVSDIQCTHP
ncbi:MAG: hypothetical protein K6T90_15605 [Leptolyngbyaceae cyanobacterium HOT.MB2.61]|jgi:hypothetical protein|nr:hypothetical protein [Leptolyngbyaceae cyanobacterium HOT.MB2.61]